MDRLIKKASTDVSVHLYIIDATDGTPETGVVWNSAGIDLKYRREGAVVVSITEADLATPALDDPHLDGGFLEVGNGVYRFDVPDAAFAAGAKHVTIFGTVTGMIVLPVEIQLVDFDPDDAVRAGLTALPNAAADAAGGLPISDAGGLDMDALAATGDEMNLADGAITAAKIAADAITEAKIADDAIANEHLATGAISADTLAADTITAAKYDETTAFPIKAADTGATQIARTGADSDTLETLSDQLDTVTAELLETTVATVVSQTEFTLTAGADFDGAYEDMLAVFLDVTNSDFPSVRKVATYTGATKTLTLDEAADFTVAVGDKVRILLGEESVYRARVYYREDAINETDHYTAVWEKNGIAVGQASITLPKIQVIKRSDGSDLIAQTAMAWDANDEMLEYDATDAERNSTGEVLKVIVTATIDGATRTDVELVGRDL